MGILIRNNIVNQKGNPAWYEDTLANRPTANLQGRMFVDTDNPSTGIYRDTGSSWVAVADPGSGTTGTLQQVTTNGSTTNVGISITTLSPGSVLFSGTGGLISQDNTNLFWDDTNNFLGIGPTGGPSALLDIHSATQNIFIQLNATSTNNSQVAFLNGGVGKWRIGNLYNAAANDFHIYDTTNSISRYTIKNTGQTFIGADTTSSGLFVVNSATSDNHIVILGANAPSLRFKNAGTGGTLNAGIGISTATNNFIQGSASGDYCLFNNSTTVSPILFGIYDSGSSNTVEATRISSAKNFLVGKTSDNGEKLQINGNVSANSFIATNPDGSNLLSTQDINFVNTTIPNAIRVVGTTSTSSGYFYFGDTSTTNYIGSNGSYLITGTNFFVSGSPSPWQTYPVIQVGNYSAISSQSNSTFLSQNYYFDTSNKYQTTGYGLVFGLDKGTGNFNFFTAPSAGSGAGNSATYSAVVTISSSGQISCGNTVTASVSNTVTNKVSIIISGVQYYLLASTSAV